MDEQLTDCGFCLLEGMYESPIRSSRASDEIARTIFSISITRYFGPLDHFVRSREEQDDGSSSTEQVADYEVA